MDGRSDAAGLRRLAGALAVLLALAFWAPVRSAGAPQPDAEPNPVLVFDTEKGTFEIELFAAEAPKSVAHIVRLVGQRFYNNQRVYRVEPGSLVQFGDIRTRDMRRQGEWGRAGGGSGRAPGVAEFSDTATHERGTVGLAHAGNPELADSQMFIGLRAHPEWKGRYVVIGRVVSGMDVVAKLEVPDRITKVTVK